VSYKVKEDIKGMSKEEGEQGKESRTGRDVKRLFKPLKLNTILALYPKLFRLYLPH
jgi:hypothetical protein